LALSRLVLVVHIAAGAVGLLLLGPVAVSACYQALGWRLVGAIPRYARSADGALNATVIYYRLLDPA
jgi:hypothetical protein